MNSQPCLSVSSVLRPLLAAVLAAASVSYGQSAPTDPRVTSWWVTPSARYARLYETDAAKSAGTSVTTWSRGRGVQSTPTYAGVLQVSYSADWVYLRSSGLGYHVMGPWYLNAAHTQLFPNYPANTDVLYRIPRQPVVPATKTLTGGGPIGYFVDGVALFDNRDTFSYAHASATDGSPVSGQRGDGIWNRDAYVNEGVTFDAAFAHQAGAQYHYHANSPALRHQLGDHVDYDEQTRTYRESTQPATRHSPILGWVADGYPLYGPFGYSSPMDPTSGVRRMIPGYVKRDGTNQTANLAATGRTTLPAWAARAQNRDATLTAAQSGPAVSSTYILGHYLEDYDYLGELGFTLGQDFDLDLYNGRFCVTPEFPEGTYAYFMSVEADGTPSFPYNIGRWFYGSPSGAAITTISEPVTEYVRGGQAAALRVNAVATNSVIAVTWNSVEGGTYSIATSNDGINFTTIAPAVTSGGLETTYSSTVSATYYRVTLVAVAAYDTGGTGGLSGLNGSGVFQAASSPTTPGASGTARVINLSTRVSVGGSAGIPITGFVIAGTGTRRMLVRVAGPSLASYGVASPLSDPTLQLVSGGLTFGSNDNWSNGDADAFAAAGAFPFTAGGRDAAIVATLAPRDYSLIAESAGEPGVALLEVYDADAGDSDARLVNVSTRAWVGTGDQVLTPGLVITGEGSVKLLIRVVGPTLATYGVENLLADPQLTLFQGSTAIGTNDNWSSATNASAIASAAAQSGAFPLPDGSRDAALLVDLAAGAYTAIASGVSGTTGVALVELYVVP